MHLAIKIGTFDTLGAAGQHLMLSKADAGVPFCRAFLTVLRLINITGEYGKFKLYRGLEQPVKCGCMCCMITTGGEALGASKICRG